MASELLFSADLYLTKHSCQCTFVHSPLPRVVNQMTVAAHFCQEEGMGWHKPHKI